MTKSEILLTKLLKSKNAKLNTEDRETIISVLFDPLQEFCKRESYFRLTEMHNYSNPPQDLIDEVEKTIRDTIDYDEELYDTIDNEIKETIDRYKEEKQNEN